jgi:hypothetical protein
MEATRFSETSVYNKPTRRHIPEDGILHSHCLENLKFYIMFLYGTVMFNRVIMQIMQITSIQFNNVEGLKILIQIPRKRLR